MPVSSGGTSSRPRQNWCIQHNTTWTSATIYYNPSFGSYANTESSVSSGVLAAATITAAGIKVYATDHAAGETETFTLIKNGVATDLTFTFTKGTTAVNTFHAFSGGPISIAPGDLISFRKTRAVAADRRIGFILLSDVVFS